jgi:exosortase/archaeosortase family protein
MSVPSTGASRAATEPSGGNREFYLLVGRFLGYLFAASLAFSLGKAHEYLGPLQSAISWCAVIGARALGDSAVADGAFINIHGYPAIFINHECTGIFVLVIYAAFLLAYPASWLARAAGILVGVTILQVVNVARLSALTVIASRWPSLFDYFHEYIWQGVFVAMLALLVAIWIDWVNRKAAVLR